MLDSIESAKFVWTPEPLIARRQGRRLRRRWRRRRGGGYLVHGNELHAGAAGIFIVGAGGGVDRPANAAAQDDVAKGAGAISAFQIGAGLLKAVLGARQ